MFSYPVYRSEGRSETTKGTPASGWSSKPAVSLPQSIRMGRRKEERKYDGVADPRHLSKTTHTKSSPSFYGSSSSSSPKEASPIASFGGRSRVRNMSSVARKATVNHDSLFSSLPPKAKKVILARDDVAYHRYGSAHVELQHHYAQLELLNASFAEVITELRPSRPALGRYGSSVLCFESWACGIPFFFFISLHFHICGGSYPAVSVLVAIPACKALVLFIYLLTSTLYRLSPLQTTACCHVFRARIETCSSL